jgi:hypothetical protein
VHIVSYFVVGAASFQLLTKQFYEGSSPVFSTFMRTPAEAELWKHTMTWFIPGQVLRGVLIAAVLYRSLIRSKRGAGANDSCRYPGCIWCLGFGPRRSPRRERSTG